jgi:hypothetical protein
LIILFPALSFGQVYNPVPDMVFRGKLSAGRSVSTDASAYFSVGPVTGSTMGIMMPRVSDTTSVVSGRRNGLLIYSIQKNQFLYWDSSGIKWKSIASESDTLIFSTKAWRQKGADSIGLIASTKLPIADTVSMLSKYLRKSDTATLSNRINLKLNTADTGTVLSPYIRDGFTGVVKSGQLLRADTVLLSTRLNAKRVVDSLGAIRALYGSFSDTTDQDLATADTEQAVLLGVTEDTLGVYISNGSRINVRKSGTYTITFSAQFIKTDSGTDDVTMWLKKNGSNVARSSSSLQLQGNNSKQLMTVNYVLSLNANDYLELFFSSADSDIQLEYIPAATSPTRPSSPSIILTINQVK